MQQHGGGARIGGPAGGRSGLAAGGDDGRVAGDEAQAAREEVPGRRRVSPRRGRGQHKRVIRRDCSRERDDSVEEHAETGTGDDAHLRSDAPRVRRPDCEHGGRAGRASDAAERRPRRALVAGGGNGECVEPRCSLGGAGERAVGERREGLDERDQGDPGSVVCVSVPVRVDRPLQAGQELVGPRVHGEVAARVSLPAGHADRQHGGGRRDSGESRRAALTDEQPGHLRAVPLELLRVGRLSVRMGVGAVADDVDPVQHVTVQVRAMEVDPGVEQRDRHAAAGDPGEADVGTRSGEHAAAHEP